MRQRRDARGVADLSQSDDGALDQERRRCGVIDDVRELGNRVLRLDVSERFHGREPDVVVSGPGEPEQGRPGARVADVPQRFRDAGVGAVGGACGGIAASAHRRVDRIEQRIDLLGAAEVLESERRFLLHQRVLQESGNAGRCLFRLELAQLLDGLDADLRIPVLELGNPCLRIARVFRLASDQRDGEHEREESHLPLRVSALGGAVNS